MNNEENKTTEVSGVTLTSLCKVAFGRKLLLIIITLVFAFTCVLAVHFTVNKNSTYYTASFEYSYTDLNNGSYISGAKFDAREILLEENLEKVKNAKDTYKNIDLESLVYNKHTIISQRKEYIELNNNQTIEKVYYDISLPQNAFSDSKQAREYIIDLVNLPINKNKEILNNLDLYNNLKLFDSAKTYEAQVGNLISQYNLIVKEYESLNKGFNNYVFNDGSRLLEKLNTVKATFIENNALENLYNEIKVNGYVKDQAIIDQLLARKGILLQEKALNESKKNELMAQRDALIAAANNLQTLDLSLYNEEIIKLSNRNNELDFEIQILDKQINNPSDTTQFDAKIKSYRNVLSKFTDELLAAKKEILDDNSLVYFESNKVISSNGGISIMLVGVGSLILGLLIALCVNLIIDHKKIQHVTINKVEKE